VSGLVDTAWVTGVLCVSNIAFTGGYMKKIIIAALFGALFFPLSLFAATEGCYQLNDQDKLCFKKNDNKGFVAIDKTTGKEVKEKDKNDSTSPYKYTVSGNITFNSGKGGKNTVVFKDIRSAHSQAGDFEKFHIEDVESKREYDRHGTGEYKEYAFKSSYACSFDQSEKQKYILICTETFKYYSDGDKYVDDGFEHYLQQGIYKFSN
jgi:hypothetical protein